MNYNIILTFISIASNWLKFYRHLIVKTDKVRPQVSKAECCSLSVPVLIKSMLYVLHKSFHHLHSKMLASIQII